MKKSKNKEMTIAEASEYFDEHDIFESKDIREVTDIKFKLQKRNMLALIWNCLKRSEVRLRSSIKAKIC